MSNIIDSIQLSGTVYTIQGSGGGSGNPTVELTQAEYDALVSAGTVAQDTYYIITDAPEVNPNDYVKKVDNNASGYTDTAIFGNKRYEYSDAYNETIYWNAGTYYGSYGSYQVGYAQIYVGSNSTVSVYFVAGISNGVITANTSSSSQYVTIELVNGELAVTPNSGYYWAGIYDSNRGTHNTKKVYSSGQSKNVIENTIYDVLDTKSEQIGDILGTMLTAVTVSENDGWINTSNRSKTEEAGNMGFVLTSSTINYSNGLNVQFETSYSGQKVLNTGSGGYCSLGSWGTYSRGYDDLTILFNENVAQTNSRQFELVFSTSGGSNSTIDFTYYPTTTSITWDTSGVETYATVTDTVSTDYKLKIVAKDGYKITYLSQNNCKIGGVDNQQPYNYVTTLITTTSYIHNGQDVIDDLYANKQDTLSAGTGISIVDNVISATGGGGGGTTYTAGRGISIANDTISVSLPISAGTGSNSLLLNIGSNANGSKSIAGGQWCNAYAEGDVIFGQMCSSHGPWAFGSGNGVSPSGKSTCAIGEFVGTHGNLGEAAFGCFNNSSHESSTFGNSGNTLFSVGNGTSNGSHNALEIRQNGDIYLSYNGNDVKLQDLIADIYSKLPTS